MVLKFLPSILLIFLLASCGGKSTSTTTEQDEGSENNTTKSVNAEELYLLNCTTCHGKDGKLCVSGAPDLSKSKRTDAEITNTIKFGKQGMPPMGDILGGDAAVSAMVTYVKGLRK